MYQIHIQLLVPKELAPKPALLKKWAKHTLKNQRDTAELTCRIVDSEEMTALNSTYRKKQGPTNVLSFPADLPAEIAEEIPLLGDIVICADVVNREAQEQGKTKESHWAHMVVHGIYHLLGYDHQTDKEAEEMEGLEIITLKQLGFGNPYDIGASIKHHD